MFKFHIKNFIVILLAVLGLTGCGLIETEYITDTPEDHMVRVVLEEDNSFYADSYVCDADVGGDVTFTIHEVCGRHVEDTDYRGTCNISDEGENTKKITLESVEYSAVVSVHASQETCEIAYHANGGTPTDESNTEDIVITVPRTHLRVNTARADELFTREGYTLVGWSLRASDETSLQQESESRDKTEPSQKLDFRDVSNISQDEMGLPSSGHSVSSNELINSYIVSPGSRIEYADHIDLYAVWIPWTGEEKFTYEDSGDGVIITGQTDGFAITDMNNVRVNGLNADDHEINTSIADDAEAKVLANDGDTTASIADDAEAKVPANDGYTTTASTDNTDSGFDILYKALVIPAEIDGKPVYGIAQEAFAQSNYQTVVLPVGLRNVENGAFRGSDVREVYLFDDLQSISGHAFDDCTELRTLHIGAARPPVYSGNYFDTFADKCDRLLEIANEPKLVLFSGSSTRFGYDSRMIEEAFGRKTVNMGVFAYANALPELLMMRECMVDGDVLLVSPEFDAAQSQFCTSRQMEYQNFAMCESNYDLIARIDLSEVTGVFGALDTFLKTRSGMEEKSYEVAAADFDEDGNDLTTPSYNEFGDYILFRLNAETEEPVYGLDVNYTTSALPKAAFIDPFNDAMSMFTEKGVQVYFTYSPRNILALSKESMVEARAELDAYLRENLQIQVISDIEESLYTGTYLYGTDNHLSTEGVQMRTERVIRDLEAAMTR